jgi:hypothetical protein
MPSVKAIATTAVIALAVIVLVKVTKLDDKLMAMLPVKKTA